MGLRSRRANPRSAGVQCRLFPGLTNGRLRFILRPSEWGCDATLKGTVVAKLVNFGQYLSS